ncbi:MAG: hypothetical protein QOK44_4837 [Betaproteobacteria bacterium]|nr:hypothetical protein [Betaproteobacteria bacterium]
MQRLRQRSGEVEYSTQAQKRLALALENYGTGIFPSRRNRIRFPEPGFTAVLLGESTSITAVV